MSYTTFAGVRTWDGTEAASIHGASAALGASIDGSLVPSFVNATARDTAAAGLIAAGRTGLTCWTVTPKALWTYDGVAWRLVPMRGLTYETNLVAVNSDESGLFSINHGLGTASLAVLLTHQWAGPDPAATYVMEGIKLHIRSVSTTSVLGFAADTRTAHAYPSASFWVSYRFERIDY